MFVLTASVRYKSCIRDKHSEYNAPNSNHRWSSSSMNLVQGLSKTSGDFFALSVLSRYLTKVTPQHGAYAKHILWYVWGCKHAKITWYASKVHFPLKAGQLHSYADSSWEDVLSSRKSTNSYDIFLNNAVVSWKTKLSAILATSTEAELISAAHCAAEVVFLRKLAEELGFHQVSPTIIYEDNNG